MYEAHARRDIEAALSLLTADVTWPDVARQTTLRGHDEARRYWTDQFATLDPRVTPVDVAVVGDEVRVSVHQVVRDLSGNLLHEGSVVHVFRFEAELIAAMRIEPARPG